MPNYQEVDIDKLIVVMDGAFNAYLKSTASPPDPKVDVAMLKMNAHTDALKKLTR